MFGFFWEIGGGPPQVSAFAKEGLAVRAHACRRNPRLALAINEPKA
jgi:hypothetical protein